ncbi:MAG: putative metal-binding motif-containing protein [Myxococcota bacterium]|nr:putative metal-binding motif-containing protein [Myxococcota bacterium]MDW8361466.1 putative metal-binding motif-containing protein [Myxococcales bacterium]
MRSCRRLRGRPDGRRRREAPWRGARALVVTLAILVGGCSALVDPDDRPLQCVVGADGIDPCPVGRICVDGVCRPPTCVPGEERCDGVDNDCDGAVDEGHDRDGDGVPWCGDARDPASRDCDDEAPDVHPAYPRSEIAAAPEVCNGRDDDCDGSVDAADGNAVPCPGGEQCIEGVCKVPSCLDAGHRCPEGQVCDTTRTPPECVAGDDCTRAGAPECGPGQECDPVTRRCRMLLPDGMPCSTDGDCQSRSCVESAALGVSGAATYVCASACCSDGDCGPEAICWSSGTGARMCVPARLLGRTVGSGAPGESCDSSSDCRSGRCAGEECFATCAVDAHCNGLACGFHYLRAPDGSTSAAFACDEPPGRVTTWGECNAHSDCRSGLCLELCWGFACVSVCGQSCATSADCPAIPVPVFGSHPTYCGGAMLSGASTPVQICLPRQHAGTARTGARCGRGDECHDRGCVAGACADTCCVSAHCPSGTQCEPVRVGSRWQMRCVE